MGNCVHNVHYNSHIHYSIFYVTPTIQRSLPAMYATFTYRGTVLRSACTVAVRYKYVYHYTPN